MMTRFLLIILIGINVSVSAQEVSLINFKKDLSWQQVLDSASKEKKIVFIDIYTDWCSPCKRMAKEVFTQKGVADIFNQRFINYSINAEKGEGIELTKKFEVTGFPYLLFTDCKGNLIYSVLGYRSEKDLIKEADLAFKESNDPKPLGIWDAEFLQNKENKVWIKSYIEKRIKLRIDNNQLLSDYYNLLDTSEYMKPENLLLIIKSKGLTLNNKVIQIIAKNFDRISPAADSAYNLQSSLIGVFDNIMNKPLLMAIKDTNENIIFNEIIPAYSIFPEKVNSMPWFEKQDGNKWKYIYYCHTKNIEKLIVTASEYFRKYYFNLSLEQIKQSDSIIYSKSLVEFKKEGMDLSSPMIKEYFSTFTTNDHLDKLIGGAYTVYNNTKNMADLNIALSWAKRAMEIREDLSTAEINVKILYALKRKDEAVNILYKAIDKTNNADEKNRLVSMLADINQNKSVQ